MKKRIKMVAIPGFGEWRWIGSFSVGLMIFTEVPRTLSPKSRPWSFVAAGLRQVQRVIKNPPYRSAEDYSVSTREELNPAAAMDAATEPDCRISFSSISSRPD